MCLVLAIKIHKEGVTMDGLYEWLVMGLLTYILLKSEVEA